MEQLPPPVARFVRLATTGGPERLDTVVIEARAAMRRPSLPTIPLRMRLSHRLGEAFVHEIRIGGDRFSFDFGIDAYVDGHGLMKVGPSVQRGVQFDQGALIAMWGEILIFPTAWMHHAGIRWEPLGDDVAILVLAGPEGDIPMTVTFDSTSGCPAACEVERYKGTGRKIPWFGTWSDWFRTDDGLLVPRHMAVRWSDEARPWLDIETIAVVPNAAVDAAVERVRRVLAKPLTPAADTRR